MNMRFESPVLGQLKHKLKSIFPDNEDSIMAVLSTAPDEMIILTAMMIKNLKNNNTEQEETT
ncbi:hypothetical protein [Fusibacter sp. 3D3]|uniref:hypothetical protein n=1 Tax=Fusibacter sp. 3D3 TaxID=1048380 RepID=UPI000852DBEC|nr:hypothetical protein [Fusibacter sp. 3D3]GAU75614.1 hypothetical protein F3D3_0205 [Fusibacter sp. 3D3]